MTHTILGRRPTEDEIHSAKVHLEFYGGEVNELLDTLNGGPLTGGYVAQSPMLAHVTEFFNKQGWVLSGSGYFSAVYVRGGLAIKVGFKREDSGATYAAWCRANQGKPGVPVIHAIDKFKHCYVVVMDRCYPVAALARHLRPACFDKERELVRDVIEHGDSPIIQFPISVTAFEIRTFFQGIVQFDVNVDNIMLDRRGGLVITDPVSWDHNGEGDSYYYYEGTPAELQPS